MGGVHPGGVSWSILPDKYFELWIINTRGIEDLNGKNFSVNFTDVITLMGGEMPLMEPFDVPVKLYPLSKTLEYLWGFSQENPLSDYTYGVTSVWIVLNIAMKFTVYAINSGQV
jgi:hypothetical protein